MEPWQIASLVSACVAMWGLYITRHGGEADGKGVYNRLQRGWRRLAFWAGDVCILHSFPWVTWDKHGHRVSEEEWMDAMAQLRAGDIVLATHEDYPLSNWAIPGCFKHAGLISNGPARANALSDIRHAKLIEAVSAGVQEWSPMRIRADRMIVLRPKDMTSDDVDRAVCRARRIVGCDYDASFNFNVEEELTRLGEVEGSDGARELRLFVRGVKAEFDMAFSCTEVVSLAWWHKRGQLRLFRSRSRGRNVIVADQMVNGGSMVVWTNVTVDEAERFGLHEEGVELLKQYWSGRGDLKCSS